MRLDPRFRAVLYATACLLFATGAAWVVVDRLQDSPPNEGWQTIAKYLLMLHGGAAMLALLVLGALIPLHVQEAWRLGKNRMSGVVMLAPMGC